MSTLQEWSGHREAPPPSWRDWAAADEVIKPESPEALAALLARCAAEDRAVYPVGGGTQLAWGLPGEKPGAFVSTGLLNQVVDYPARDMTITVRAGMRFGELQAVLADEGQWLPLDVPQATEATVGGAVATAIVGPRRFGHGSFRDYVIGIAVATMEGRIARAGGRVVKNVAGYDLCKLYTGSFGSLAIITEVTFRVKPRPEAHTALLVRCSSLEAADELLNALVTSRTRPVAVELVNDRAARQLGIDLAGPWGLVIAYEGFQDTVAWQERQLADELSGHSGVELGDRLHEEAWQRLVDERFRHSPLFKLGCRPSQLAPVLARLQETSVPWCVQAEAANGIAWLWSQQREGIAEAAATLSNEVAASGGYLIARDGQWCRTVGFAPWGKARGDLAMMRRLKEVYDPKGLLNPGRFVDHPHAVETVEVS